MKARNAKFGESGRMDETCGAAALSILLWRRKQPDLTAPEKTRSDAASKVLLAWECNGDPRYPLA
jgi:hypothetical protein